MPRLRLNRELKEELHVKRNEMNRRARRKTALWFRSDRFVSPLNQHRMPLPRSCPRLRPSLPLLPSLTSLLMNKSRRCDSAQRGISNRALTFFLYTESTLAKCYRLRVTYVTCLECVMAFRAHAFAQSTYSSCFSFFSFLFWKKRIQIKSRYPYVCFVLFFLFSRKEDSNQIKTLCAVGFTVVCLKVMTLFNASSDQLMHLGFEQFFVDTVRMFVFFFLFFFEKRGFESNQDSVYAFTVACLKVVTPFNASFLTSGSRTKAKLTGLQIAALELAYRQIWAVNSKKMLNLSQRVSSDTKVRNHVNFIVHK